MNKFETKCPNCGAELTVQEEWIGMEVECPQCKNTFTVQGNPDQSAFPAASSVPASAQTDNGGTFTFVCPDCNAVAELPKNLLGQQYECQMCFETHIAEATTERQCPFCGQTIKYHATVCKFCKADLTKAPPPSAPKPEETFVFICPECDTVEFLPVSMKGQQYECKKCCETSTAEPAEERKCPHCGEKIKVKAAVCKHCRKKVKPLTPPPPPTDGGAMQILSDLKQTGARFFRSRQDPQVQPTVSQVAGGQVFWGISEAEADSIWNTANWLLIGMVSPVFIFLMSLAVHYIGWGDWLVTCLKWLVNISVFILWCSWIYSLWKLVPAAEAETTPGKAVGFCLIPIYNIYWFIKMPYNLSKHYDQFDDSRLSVSKWWIIYLTSAAVSFCMPILTVLNRPSAADRRAASEFFGTSSTSEPGVPISLIVVLIICYLLNNGLLANWLIRLRRCIRNIPRVG